MLFTNEYEKNLLETKTGLSEAEVLERVKVRVTTQGKRGVEIVGRGHRAGARPGRQGARQGRSDRRRRRLPGRLPGRPHLGAVLERSAQVGSLLATLVLETVGTQEYQVKPSRFADRLAESYGDDAAAEVLPQLTI